MVLDCCAEKGRAAKFPHLVNKENNIMENAHRSLTVPSKAEVRVLQAVKLTRGGLVVASIDAIYDFSAVPPQYHQALVNLIPPPQELLLPLQEEDCTY